jgi:hypothetical protein
MALIICPDPSCDSFVDLVDAENYISMYTLHSDVWEALSDEDQERYLRIAYRVIVDNAIIPDPIPTCLAQAQSLIAVNDLVYGISSEQLSTTGATRKEKVGSLEVEYFSPRFEKTIPLIPPLARDCLESIGWYINNLLGLKQLKLGRS